MSKTQPTLTEYADSLSQKLETFFVGSLPALPDSVKEFIVKVSPYLTLIMMLMVAPLLLGALGLGTILMPFSFFGGLGSGFSYILTLVMSLGTLVLQLIALPGLFKRQKRSWTLVYYATLLSLLDELFTFRLGSLVVSALLSFYFLFQVKSKYTK